MNVPPLTSLPSLYRVRQTFPGTPLPALTAATEAALAALDLPARVRPGQRIAVMAGSRGILAALEVTRAVVAELRRLGCEPWVVPAMGSHGGATAEGQAEVLAGYGFTAAAIGAPVISQPDVVPLGESAEGVPLFCDRLAFESDGLIVINRVKPHTDFHGLIESGPTKMLAIGLGKWHSARACHTWFVERGYERVLRDVGDALWARLPILGGLGIVENGHHHTVAVEPLRPESHEADEAALLVTARQVFGGLPFEKLDVLLVDRIGKDISGSGMDPNVTGAENCRLHDPRTSPFIWRIGVRDLTEATHGNATGIGNADFALRRLVEKIDWHATATNAVTAASPEGARCPVVCDNDAELLAAAFHTSGPRAPQAKRLVWIRDTLSVDELLVAEGLLDEARAHPRCEVVDGPLPMTLDEEGFLVTPS